jgi:hypothetical protein
VYAWIIQHTWRELIGAAVLLAVILFYVGWTAHERGIGEHRCEAAQAAAFAAGQKAADEHAATANAGWHATYDPVAQAITDNQTRYHAPPPDDGCAPVRYIRKQP